MSDDSFVQLSGSQRGPLADVEPAGAIDGSERIELTIVTRRRAELPLDAAGVPVRLTRRELQHSYGADPADLELVADTLSGLGLEVTGQDAGSRRVTVAGTVSALAATFGAELSMVTSPFPGGSERVAHRYREGTLQIPAELDGIVAAVVGLDNRPQSRFMARRADPAAAGTSYTPPQVAQIYQFPAGTDGTGQTIGIIELGGGYSDTDLDSYFSGLGLSVPSVTAQGVDGASNVPDQAPNGADGEVLLDIEVAGSVAHGAAHRGLFRAQHRPGFHRRGDHRGPCNADPRGGEHQLGPVGGLVDRSVQIRARRCVRRRRGARRNRVRGGRRWRQHRRRHRQSAAR